MANAEAINVEFNTSRGDARVGRGGGEGNQGSSETLAQRLKRQLDPFNHSLLENVLASLVFILLILVIALAATHGDSGGDGGAGSGLNDTCQSQVCLLRSASTLALADLTASPCDDFYKYACGLAPKSMRLSADQLERTIRGDLQTENENRLEEVLRSPVVRNTINSYERKVKGYFSLCVNDFITERVRGNVLVGFLESDLYLLNASKADNFSLDTMLTKAYMGFGADAFFEYFVVENFLDNDKYTISITSGGIAMPAASYVSTEDSGVKHRAAYSTYIRNVAAFLVADADPGKVAEGSLRRVDQFVDDVMEIETELARMAIEAASPEKPPLDPENLRTLAQLDYIYPFVSWTHFFGDSFRPNAPPETKVAVQSPDYLKRVSDYVNQLQQNLYKRKLSNYVNWRIIHQHVGDLSSGYVHAWREFQSVLSVRSQVFESRFDYCFRRTKEFMRHGVSGLFVAGHSSHQTKAAIDDMYTALQKELITAIDRLTWIDANARAKSKEKVTAIIDKIGYSEDEVSDAFLDAFYDKLTVDPSDYMLDLAVSRQNFHREYQSNLLGKQPNQDSWDGATFDTNLHMNNQRVQLTIPAGIMQWPYFHRSLQKFVNYATMGQLIATELVKSIDATGQIFDKEGKANPMWAADTVLGYVQKATCINQTFSGMRAGPYGNRYVSIDGIISRHLRNLIASADGLRMALRAYTQLMGQSEAPLPLAQLSRMQSFFMAWSQTQCYNRDPDYSVTKIQTLKAMPEELIVNGILSTMPEFQQTFGCPSGSKMVRSAGSCPGVFYV